MYMYSSPFFHRFRNFGNGTFTKDSDEFPLYFNAYLLVPSNINSLDPNH